MKSATYFSIRFWMALAILLFPFIYYHATNRVETRRSAHQNPEAKFGLVPVDDYSLPACPGGVDIIFVHGLGSNPDTTWRAKATDPINRTPSDSEQYVNWVSDLLPSDLPSAISQNIRLFFYNYDSYWKRDSLYTRLPILANDLLDYIGQIHVSQHERSRGLIFVGHSYGGLVVKQALVQSTLNQRLSHIAENTKAVFFLGTPHRGSSYGVLGWLQAQALRPRGSNPLVLANLKYDSPELLDLQRAFEGAVLDELRVFNFFEQVPLQYWLWEQFCVSEQSATYGAPPKVENIGLPVNHFNLNKFGSRTESYRRLRSKLVEVMMSSVRPAKHHYAVPAETVQSYTQRDALWKELEEKLQIRHEGADVPYAVAIHGLGGVGKSQLVLKYAEQNKDRYNPILWIDALNEETVRSSFYRCAAELGLPEEQSKQRSSTLVDDVAIQGVLRWLRDRTDTDNKWLVIFDNADDFSWGIKKVMPKGAQGSTIITSQDQRSPMLLPKGCEEIRVGVMTPREGTALLLQHLNLTLESAPEDIRMRSHEVTEKLGYLPLALDLAGAYIGNDPVPEQALSQFLIDYDMHRNEVLQMDGFRGLMPTEKTVWTVWDTTLQKLARDHPRLEPGLFLAFLARFKGSVIQDEMFRLAALGTTFLVRGSRNDMPTEFLQFFSVNGREWDSFPYRQTRDLLIRYHLLHRVEGNWPGVSMHSLVQWRAIRSEQDRPWDLWYLAFILGACRQATDEFPRHRFRQQLVVHLPEFAWRGDASGRGRGDDISRFIGRTFAELYFGEARWTETENILLEVILRSMGDLEDTHPDLTQAVAALARVYARQGRLEEAENLQVGLVTIFERELGPNDPTTLESTTELASIYSELWRLDEAETLAVQVLKAPMAESGPRVTAIVEKARALLAWIYSNQDRLEEAEELCMQVLERCEIEIPSHAVTMSAKTELARIYSRQFRWQEAEMLLTEVLTTNRAIFGPTHPITLASMENLKAISADRGLGICMPDPVREDYGAVF